MAQRPIWRGHHRLALVCCRVALYTARQAAGDLHFHSINEVERFVPADTIDPIYFDGSYHIAPYGKAGRDV